MHRSLSALIVAGLLAAAPAAAIAAPTCQDHNGQTIRCGTDGAMPVGWRLPDDQRPDREARMTPQVVHQLVAVAAFLVGLFGLIALMPDFDGAGWDKQEGDGEEPQG